MSSFFLTKAPCKRKKSEIVSTTTEWIKKQLKSSVNLISKSQNLAITFINKQTYPYKIKIEEKILNQKQIPEDCAITGGALPLLLKILH